MWAHPPLFPLSRDREKEFHLLLEELKLNRGRFLMYFMMSAGHHFNLCLVCQALVPSDSDHEAVVGDRHGVHDWLMCFFAAWTFGKINSCLKNKKVHSHRAKTVMQVSSKKENPANYSHKKTLPVYKGLKLLVGGHKKNSPGVQNLFTSESLMLWKDDTSPDSHKDMKEERHCCPWSFSSRFPLTSHHFWSLSFFLSFITEVIKPCAGAPPRLITQR